MSGVENKEQEKHLQDCGVDSAGGTSSIHPDRMGRWGGARKNQCSVGHSLQAQNGREIIVVNNNVVKISVINNL